jgi:CubicO group peptidase (beta-lactamase class C family)
VNDDRVAGVSIAVIRRGEVVKRAAYGRASLELDAPARPETVYEIGSITKPFTAVTVLKLMEEGKLALEDPVSKFLDALPEAWRSVTIEQLLAHTSGIPSYTSATDFIELSRQVRGQRQILDLVGGKPLDFEPGERWSYNNTGYFLLGMVIEKVEGTSYERALRRVILDPLDMRQTRAGGPTPVVPGRARGYSRMGEVWVNRDPLQPTVAFSAGCLLSTVDDLVKFDRGMRSGLLLSEETFSRAWQAGTVRSGTPTRYGLGFTVHERQGQPYRGHNGGTPGFSSSWMWFPKLDLSIIVLTNASSGAADRLAFGIAGLVEPALKLPERSSEPDPKPELTEQHRGVLGDVLAGKEVEAFAREFAEFMARPEARATSRELAEQGELKGFEYLRQSGDGRVRFYRMTLGKAVFIVRVTSGEHGKIVGLLIQPGD